MKSEVACMVFKGDNIALKKSVQIPNSIVIEIDDYKSILKVFNEYQYVIMLHNGNDVTNEFLMKLLMLSVEEEVQLGFIVHPELDQQNINDIYEINGEYGTHALLNHLETANYEINTEDFWYGSGKEASIENLTNWSLDKKPSVISILSHSRENLIYAVDGMLCAFNEKVDWDGPLPSCYATGVCYRSDLKPYSISMIESDLLILNGCTNFKLSDEVYNPKSTLLGKLIMDKPRNIIGSPMIKVAHLEENFYIHTCMGRKSLGKTVLDLNKVYIDTGTGEPAFALWGDPRIVLPKVVNEESRDSGRLGGKLKYYNLVSQKVNSFEEEEQLDTDKEFNLIRKGYRHLENYSKWHLLGLQTNSVSGLLSQLESLLKGTNKLIAEANLIKGGRIHKKLIKKTRQINQVIESIDSKMMTHSIEKASSKGFELAESYRESFIIENLSKTICPICNKDAYEYLLDSPTTLRRKMINCPTCGVPSDSPINYDNAPKFFIRTNTNKIEVIFEKFLGEVGVTISSGNKYGFDKFSKEIDNKGRTVFKNEINNIKPHRYQLKIYHIYNGNISSFQDIIYISKDGQVYSCMESKSSIMVKG